MKSNLIFAMLVFALAAFQPALSVAQQLEASPAAIDATAVPADQKLNKAAVSSAVGQSISTVLPFSKLGAFRPMQLKGISDSKSIGVGVRLDRIVTGARLRLTYTYSPALVFSMSHIRVLVNQQVVATVPFKAGNAGSPVVQDIELNPLYFTNFNQITFQLIAHYTINQCEDPANSALWADISPTSELVLDERPVALPNDLGLLPAPFFDRGDSTRLVLPFVFTSNPGNELLHSAGVVASWFGMLADYRGARFPVTSTVPTDSNAVLMGTEADLPASIRVAKVEGPTIAMIDNPLAPGKKILLLLGRDNREVNAAAEALVLGKAVLSGSRSLVGDVDIGPPRKPYDAPKWLSLNGPVQFKDLVDDPAVLQVRGSAPDPIRVDMHVPADLFEWRGRGVPIDLKYRYTAPSVVNDSTLTVAINGSLVKSYRLTPRKPEESKSGLGLLRVPLLNDSTFGASNEFNVPAFHVGSDNQLQIEFTLDSQKSGMCTGVAFSPARAAIDPDSTIDFSGFAHYAVMPNLAFFANSGFPFTIMADLANTAVVIPDHPVPADLETMLTVMGYMGKWTGIPALRVQVLRSSEVHAPLDKDLLVIGSGSSAALFKGWVKVSPLRISADSDGKPSRFTVSLTDGGTEDTKASSKRHVFLDEGGGLGALIGVKSPFHTSRSIVAITGTDTSGMLSVLDALGDPGKVLSIQGGMDVVHGGIVEPVPTGGHYAIGDLPWYANIWIVALKHPALLALFGILAGIMAAVGIFLGLQALASRRRGI
jgi:hypothetical protein